MKNVTMNNEDRISQMNNDEDDLCVPLQCSSPWRNQKSSRSIVEIVIYERVYLPQMWSIKTDAMKSKLITNTGTGPLQQK